MQVLKIGVIGVAFSAFAIIATAQADDCQNASSQSALNECYGKAYKKSDGELNKIFKTLQRRADDADLKKNWFSRNGHGSPFATPNATCRQLAAAVFPAWPIRSACPT